MLVELSLMMLSAAVMIFLLVHKKVEMERGSRTMMHDVRAKTDPLLRDIHQTTGQVLSGVTLHNFILLLNHLFVAVVRFFMKASHRVHKTSSAIVEKASKKREDLTRSGAASFYLKQIKESRESKEREDQSEKSENPPETGTEEEKM